LRLLERARLEKERKEKEEAERKRLEEEAKLKEELEALAKEEEEFKGKHPGWTCFKPKLDLYGRGDVKSIGAWKDKHSLEDIKKMVVDNKWTGFALAGGAVYFKKVDNIPKKEDLDKVSHECELWVYDPAEAERLEKEKEE
jgi:hypothetical protein